MFRTLLIGITFILLALPATLALAQAPAATAPETPAKVEMLLELLDDPEVRTWLETRQAEPADERPDTFTTGEFLSNRLDAIRLHLVDIISAVTRLPAELERAVNRLHASGAAYGFAPAILLSLAFIGLGLIAEWLYRHAAAPLRQYSPRVDVAGPGSRARSLGALLLLGLGSAAAFGLGGVGAFLAFDWPPLLRTVVVYFLLAAVITMLVRGILNAFLLPFGERFNSPGFVGAHPIAAEFYRRRLLLAVGWFAFAYAFAQSLLVLGVEFHAGQLVAYFLGLVLLSIGLEMVWNRPGSCSEVMPSRGRSWFFTFCLVLLWLIWIAGTMRLFWLLAVAIALPLLVKVTGKMVSGIYSGDSAGAGTGVSPGVAAEVARQTIRALLIIAAVLLLAWGWGFDFDTIMNLQDPAAVLARRILMVLVVLLAADLVWQVTKTLIDSLLARAQDPGAPGTPEAIRRAKSRTLLPIVRNVLMVFLLVLAAMMSLTSLGVEIGPLIASAGVIGIAVGFGAQTLVKDIFSGMFYLLDDAFRVGEYIVSGQFKGTVESFSLRSVRLRHHLGPIYTIPFGELGAIQNMSRDFVIDRLSITVTYDTDIEMVRKLIKKIGQQLAEDPELAGSIIQPLKMQRINAFGDYGIEIRLKVMTKPGEQFALRQKAYPLIKKVFDENNIEFAFPTVRVAAEADNTAAAAQQVINARAKRGKSQD
jgi:moderate conductance mechanosensitive channel